MVRHSQTSSVVSGAGAGAGVRTSKRVMAETEVDLQRHAEAIDHQSQELTQQDKNKSDKKRRRRGGREENPNEGEEEDGRETRRNRRTTEAEVGANTNNDVDVNAGAGASTIPRRVRAKGSWRAGFIRRVHIENFMKHRNFTVDFGPNVTFISGKNGSGKSATLQAIQCCLGVKAKQMGRGNSMGSFVRHGSNSALVVVTLSNEGSDGYKRETFGSTITVERRIDKKGQGGFTIRDERGNKVGTTKWELDDILDHLSLMVSNPCVVTTQDIARTFLSGDTNDSSRYKLFMQATMLDVVKENLSGTKLTLGKMNELLVVKEKEVNKKLAEMKVVKKQRDRARSIADITVLERQCENLLVWSEVLTLEENVQDLMHKIDVKAPALMEHIEEKIGSARQTLEQAEADQQQRGEAVENFNSEMENLRNSSKDAKENITKLAAQEVKQQKSLERVKKEMKNLEQEKVSLEEILKGAENVDVSSTQAIKDVHQKEIDEKKEHLEWIRRQEDGLKQNLDQMRDSKHEVEGRLDNLGHQKYRINQNISELQRSLQELSRPVGQETVDAEKFGQGYRNLVSQIQRSKRSFNRPPIGPIGIHLEITDHNYGLAVQAAIGNRLGTFIVHDEHDRIALQKCARQARSRMPVTITSSFDRQMIHVPRNKLPPQDYATVASILKCTHPTCSHVIWNMLIDYARIESTVLLQDFNQGKFAIFQKRAYPSSRGFLADGTLMELRGSTQITRAVLQDWQRAQLNTAGRDATEDKAAYEAEIHERRNQLRELENDMNSLEQKMREISADYHRREEEVDELGEKAITADAEIQEMYEKMQEAIAEAAGGRGSDDAEGIRAQIAEVQLKVEQSEAKVQSLEAVILQLGNEMNTLREQFGSKRDQREKLLQNNENMLSNAQALDDQVLKAREDVDDCLQAKRVTEKKISKLKQDLAKHKPVYDNKLSVAEETCPRDELDQSKQGVEAHWEGAIDLKENTDVADIERLLKKLRANIKSFEKESGSLEELELKFYKADKEYEQAQKMYMKIADPFALINSGVDDRWRTFRSMRKSIAKQTNFMFQGYMGKRGYSGKLHLNHDQETLKITVNVGDGKSGSAKTGKVRDMKSLSGGERSLSTLCFVLSLGTNCESPFRASDEFDVFMDAVNRKVSLRTLLHFAVESPETQMILLTPQDLAAVDEVKVELKENENYHEKFIKLIVMPSV